MLNLSFFNSISNPSINYFSNEHNLWNSIDYQGSDSIFLRISKYDIFWVADCFSWVYLSKDYKSIFYEWSSMIFFFFVAKLFFTLLIFDLNDLSRFRKSGLIWRVFWRRVRMFLVREKSIKRKWKWNLKL